MWKMQNGLVDNYQQVKILSSVGMNVPVTGDQMICQASYSLDNPNKRTMASHIPFLVWALFLNCVDFNSKGEIAIRLCINLNLPYLIGCIINNLLVVASLMILGSKIQREYLQDEIFVDLNSVLW